MKSYITFGQNHKHIVGDVIFDKDCVCLIEHSNAHPDFARKLACDVFGSEWCFEYSEQSFPIENMQYFPRGVIKFPKEF